MSDPIAHVRRTTTGEFELHDLAEHLREVAALGREFARPFGGGEWAHLAGLWHDLGKYRARFQRYIGQASGYDPDAHIEGKPGKAPHSTAGALLACDKLDKAGRVLAYLIAGHHAGLSDWNSEHYSLQYRLGRDDSRGELDEARAAQPPADVLAAADHFKPDLRNVPGRPAPDQRNPLGFALWIRMLFSCLVDADFLDTEAFMEGDKSRRHGKRRILYVIPYTSIIEQKVSFCEWQTSFKRPCPAILILAQALVPCAVIPAEPAPDLIRGKPE